MPQGHPVHAPAAQQASGSDENPSLVALNIGSPPDARRAGPRPLSSLKEGSETHQHDFSGMRPETRLGSSTPSAAIPYRRPTGFSSVGGSPQGESRFGLQHTRSSPPEGLPLQRHSISGTAHASVSIHTPCVFCHLSTPPPPSHGGRVCAGGYTHMHSAWLLDCKYMHFTLSLMHAPAW